MGRDGARPSRGKQMVRNGHWNFDRDLEGARSLGAGNPVGTMFSSRGCKGLQPSKVNDVFQGGMASVPSQFSPCYNYKG